MKTNKFNSQESSDILTMDYSMEQSNQTTDLHNWKPIQISTPHRRYKSQRKVDPGISQTVPGQSQKLKSILSKYKVGIPAIGHRQLFSETPELDRGINPKSLDYVDIQNLSNENLQRINALQQERQLILQEARETASQRAAENQKIEDQRLLKLLEEKNSIK